MSVAPNPDPKAAIVGTIALLCTTVTVIGAARFGTPYELGISVLALLAVIAGCWRWSR